LKARERRGARERHRQLGPRAGAGELLAAGAQQSEAVAFVPVECRKQSRHVLAAGHRQFRLELDSQRFRRRTGGHPFGQRVLRALGG
jgi:hypothetical protein